MNRGFRWSDSLPNSHKGNFARATLNGHRKPFPYPIPDNFNTNNMKYPRFLTSILVRILYVLVKLTQGFPRKNIVEAFHQKYPEATFPTWEFQGERLLEVTFTSDRKEHCAIFDTRGNWLGTRTLISRSLLPVKIWEHLKVNFIKPDFLKIVQLNMPQGKFYELDIYDGSNFVHFFYDGKGVLQNKGTL